MERCLLVVPAVHAGEVVAEDHLVDVLWEGAPPRTASVQPMAQHIPVRVMTALTAPTAWTPWAAWSARRAAWVLDHGSVQPCRIAS